MMKVLQKKLDVAFDLGCLIEIGKNQLITLEDTTIDGRTFEKDIIKELGDDNITDENDAGELEETVREHWQIGQRQLSAKSNLSIAIRRGHLIDFLYQIVMDSRWQILMVMEYHYMQIVMLPLIQY